MQKLRILLAFGLLALTASGQANVAVVQEFRTVAPSTSFAGSFTLDGAGGFGWDLDGDGAEDLIAYNGSRCAVLRDDGRLLLHRDGYGSEPWKLRESLVVRVGAQKHVLVRPASSCAQSWCAHTDIEVVALYQDAHYTFGQSIAQLPFGPGDPDPNVFTILCAGLAAIDPGQSVHLVAVSRNICRLRTFELAVAANGVVTFTPVATLPCPTLSHIAGNGAALYEIRDGQGQNPEWFLFANEVRRIPDLSLAASWPQLNGQTVPVRQGGTTTLSFGFAIGNHIDSTVVVNRGTAQSPQYWVYGVFDNGVLFAATLAKSGAGALTFTPQFATVTGNFQVGGWGPGAEAVAVGRLRGLSTGRHLACGRYVFDLDGNIVADLNAQTPDPAQRRYLPGPELWTASPAGAYVRDTNYGFEVQGNILAHVLPSGSPPDRPYDGFMLYQLWAFETGRPWGRPPSFAQGIPHWVGPYIDIDASGNVFERLVVFRSQQDASVLRASTEQPLINGPLTPLQRDQLLTHVQQATAMRSFDTLWLERAMGIGN